MGIISLQQRQVMEIISGIPWWRWDCTSLTTWKEDWWRVRHTLQWQTNLCRRNVRRRKWINSTFQNLLVMDTKTNEMNKGTSYAHEGLHLFHWTNHWTIAHNIQGGSYLHPSWQQAMKQEYWVYNEE
jgi:hypothetical protein